MNLDQIYTQLCALKEQISSLSCDTDLKGYYASLRNLKHSLELLGDCVDIKQQKCVLLINECFSTLASNSKSKTKSKLSLLDLLQLCYISLVPSKAKCS